MFIDQFMNNGVPYLRLVESRRVTTKNGKLTSVKSVIMNLGPLSRFDDGKPDYLARLRQSYRDGKPIIDALLPYVKKREEQITLTFTSGAGECVSHPKLFADAILSAAFRNLGLTSLFGAIKRNSAIQYDLVDFARLVTFRRILNPGSKMAAVRQNENYQTPILSGEFNPDNIYDMLDLVYENRYRIYRTINKAISSHMHRDTSVIFYDVTSFYYETDLPDLDETDESRNVLSVSARLGWRRTALLACHRIARIRGHSSATLCIIKALSYGRGARPRPYVVPPNFQLTRTYRKAPKGKECSGRDYYWRTLPAAWREFSVQLA